MTSLVHSDRSTEHLGASHSSTAIGTDRTSKQSAGSAGMALALVVAAGVVFLVLADPLTTREIDSGWMVAWIAVCAIFFGAMALSAHKITPFLTRLAARRAIARADAQLYETAKDDPRILQELRAAVTRHQADGNA